MNYFLRRFSLWLGACALAGTTSCMLNDPIAGTTLVSGQVIDGQTRQSVPGATVQVYQGGSGGGYGAIDAGHRADGQGRFSFTFDATQKGGYLVRASCAPGYLTEWGLEPALTAGRKNENLLIPLLAPAWLRLHLVDESPKNQVIVHTQGYEGPGDTFYYPRDTTVIRPVFAKGPGQVYWFITDEKGVSTTHSATFAIQALDTVTVRIPF